MNLIYMKCSTGLLYSHVVSSAKNLALRRYQYSPYGHTALAAALAGFFQGCLEASILSRHCGETRTNRLWDGAITMSWWLLAITQGPSPIDRWSDRVHRSPATRLAYDMVIAHCVEASQHCMPWSRAFTALRLWRIRKSRVAQSPCSPVAAEVFAQAETCIQAISAC